MTFCIYVISFVISPHILIILFVWVFYLFFLVSLDKYLLILFIFSKNELLVLLIFSIFYSLFDLFLLKFLFHFLLLTLGLVCYFSNWTGPLAILQFFHLYLIPIGQTLQIPPVICLRRDPSGPPSKCLTMWMKLNVYLGSFYPTGVTVGMRSPLGAGAVPALWGRAL